MKKLIKIALLCLLPIMSLAQTPAYEKATKSLRVTDNGQIIRWKNWDSTKNVIVQPWTATPTPKDSYRTHLISGIEYLFRSKIEANISEPVLLSTINAWTDLGSTSDGFSPDLWSGSITYNVGDFARIAASSRNIFKSKTNGNIGNTPIFNTTDSNWECVGTYVGLFNPSSIYSLDNVVFDSDETNKVYRSNVNNNNYPLNGQIVSSWQLIGIKPSDVSVPDATTTVKGKIKLAGDLSGTADLPTVPGLALKVEVVSDISDLIAYHGQSRSLIVQDSIRGGIFDYFDSGLTADDGVVFNAANGGFWKRRVSDHVFSEFWGTGTVTSRSYIQAALNYAAGKPLKVLLKAKRYNIDSTLIISSNTTLELDKRSVVFLNDSVSRTMLRNKKAVYEGSKDILDSNIVIKGGLWRGNGLNQDLYSPGVNPSVVVGISLHNIRNARLSDLKIDSARTYAVFISSSDKIYIDRVEVDNSNSIFDRNMDGLHFNGPAKNTFINDCILRSTDDAIAMNANDVPYAYKVNDGGDIENTIINNIVLNDTYKFIRLLSAANNVKNTVINGLTGTTTGNLIELGSYELGTGGHIDNLQFTNVNVKINQQVDHERAIISFFRGGYKNVLFNNVVVGGNHFNNPTIEIITGVDINTLKFSNFNSYGLDTLSYSDVFFRQGIVEKATIRNLIFDGYNYISPIKQSVKLLDINNLISDNLQVINSVVDTAKTILSIDSSSVRKLTLLNNTNLSSSLGNVITSSTIDSVYINGDRFKDNNNLSFTKDALSTVSGIYVNPTVKNNNSNVTSSHPITYKSNGTVYSIEGVAPTLDEVLTSGATSTQTVNIGALSVGTSTKVYLADNAIIGLSSPLVSDNLIIRAKGTGSIYFGYGDGSGGIGLFNGGFSVGGYLNGSGGNSYLNNLGGNLLIGTSIDNGSLAKLQVNGKVTVSETPTNPTDVARYADIGTGWAQYSDNVHTSGSPLVINSGTTATITNNAATSIMSQLPIGVTALYDPVTSKITPENNGDSYLVNVRFTATSSSVTGLADVGIDIGGAMNIVSQETVSLRKGIGNSQRVNIVFDVFSGSTFLSNGGLIKLTSIDGNTSIYDISYKITRTHKAK